MNHRGILPKTTKKVFILFGKNFGEISSNVIEIKDFVNILKKFSKNLEKS